MEVENGYISPRWVSLKIEGHFPLPYGRKGRVIELVTFREQFLGMFIIDVATSDRIDGIPRVENKKNALQKPHLRAHQLITQKKKHCCKVGPYQLQVKL